jgi:hypothetical protein
MHRAGVVAGFVLLALVVTACQDPAGESMDAPTTAPVAPAVEPTHPDAERTIPLPSDAPIAPAIEPEPTGPDPTIDVDPG